MIACASTHTAEEIQTACDPTTLCAGGSAAATSVGDASGCGAAIIACASTHTAEEIATACTPAVICGPQGPRGGAQARGGQG